MLIQEIKQAITDLARQHAELNEVSLGDANEAELLEWQAESLIIEYCENKEYLINGFPTEIKRRYENNEISDEEYDEDFFCDERYRLYLDMLSLEKEDVAALNWHYTQSFWPDIYTSITDFLESIKENIESGVFYDCKL
jgi:hypothetical protein